MKLIVKCKKSNIPASDPNQRAFIDSLTIDYWSFNFWLFDSWFSDFWKLKLENKIENWKLQIENWKLKIGNWNLKLCVGIPSNCGLPLWPPTVASHCGLPLWEAMGIPLKIALNQFAYVFLREATGGHSWRPWEYHSQLLLINFLMFSYGRPREATGIPKSALRWSKFPFFD